MKTLRKLFVVAMSLMMLLTMMPMATGVAFADETALVTSINAQVMELEDIPKVEVKTSNSKLVLDGYEVFRSTKRYSGYGKTCFFDTKNLTYNNTKVDIGKRYFYKVRGYVLVDGERYYTPFSTKAYRKVLSTAKNKLSAVRKNTASDATMLVTGEDLAKALDKVKFKANSKLVKRSNGMPAVSLNWTADTSGHTLTDVNAAVEETPTWHYYGGGGGPITPAHTHSYESKYYALNESTGEMTLVCDSCYEAMTPLTTFTGNYFAVKQSNEYYKVYELASSSNLTNLGVTVSGTDYKYASSNALTVAFRTSEGATLEINAPNSVVKHYGTLDTLNIIAVAGSSYHEHGTVPFVQIASGNIVLEETSEVYGLHFAANENGKFKNADGIGISVDISNVAITPEFSRDSVTIDQTEGTTVCVLSTGDKKNEVKLFQQGIYEQIKIIDVSDETPGEETWADSESTDDKTKACAAQIANNIVNDSGEKVDVTFAADDTERKLENATNIIEVANALGVTYTPGQSDEETAASAKNALSDMMNNEEQKAELMEKVDSGVEAEQASKQVTGGEEYGFANSYKKDGHWVHEIDTASQFKNIIIPNEAASALKDKAGWGDVKTVYIVKGSISFDLKTPWQAAGIPVETWQNFVFNGTLGGESELNVATIKDIRINEDTSELTGTEFEPCGGIFALYGNATVTNLIIDNVKLETNKLKTTGLIFGGPIESAKFFAENVNTCANCSVSGNSSLGGFVGGARGAASVRFIDCVNNANITSNDGHSVGGFIGSMSTGSGTAYFENCINNGLISCLGSNSWASGFIGTMHNMDDGVETITLINCESNGDIKSPAANNGKTVQWFVGVNSKGKIKLSNYSRSCANNKVNGTLYCDDEKYANTAIVEAVAQFITFTKGEAALHHSVEKLGILQYTFDVNSKSFGIVEFPGAKTYEVAIHIAGYELTPDYETGIAAAGEDRTAYFVTKEYSSLPELNSEVKLINRIGYFLPTDGEHTHSKVGPGYYGAFKFQEFALPESVRGQVVGGVDYSKTIQVNESGAWTAIFINDGSSPLTALTRPATSITYTISAYDENGTKIAGNNFSYSIDNKWVTKDASGVELKSHDILPIGQTEFKPLSSYEW